MFSKIEFGESLLGLESNISVQMCFGTGQLKTFGGKVLLKEFDWRLKFWFR